MFFFHVNHQDIAMNLKTGLDHQSQFIQKHKFNRDYGNVKFNRSLCNRNSKPPMQRFSPKTTSLQNTNKDSHPRA